ncbi:aprataxin and PNK-like factor isoform X3 [Zootermopsis nevadensis]|uniref:Aprataxin and PNK-like factor n=1 Tax=Zootermopsis nevadensis TaxID=136037 RepID=A0A067RFR2_ZOONE|nr:aprataxin and PNK-like factor isoform X3 [Zootermopsis nevadensis]KDR22686.1 Aprataxin and PNK-like factor [Zootermopsis nevadensis]
MKNICLVRQDEKAGELNIALGEATIGRGPLIGCTDKRVSRQHARMKLSEEGDVILEAIHTNPFFYIKGEKPPVEVSKGDFIIINDGDEFTLLPDSYRYRIIIRSETGSDQNGHVEAEQSTTEAQGTRQNHKRHLPAWMLNLTKDGLCNNNIKMPSSSKVSTSRRKREDVIKHENAVQKKVKVDSEDSSGSEKNKRLIGNDSSLDRDVSESKWEPQQTKFHEMSDDEDGGTTDGQKVEAETGGPIEDEPNTTTQTSDSSVSVTQHETAKVQKKKCVYGAKCYRKNPQHHDEFSHPGDPDYDDDLPECPYGITCYRKNKQHRLDFKHSTRPCRAKRPQTKNQNSDNEDDDDDDYDDPFLNDASSDDYQPTGSGSDISDRTSSGDEESDARRMMKEAKTFIRKKK